MTQSRTWHDTLRCTAFTRHVEVYGIRVETIWIKIITTSRIFSSTLVPIMDLLDECDQQTTFKIRILGMIVNQSSSGSGLVEYSTIVYIYTSTYVQCRVGPINYTLLVPLHKTSWFALLFDVVVWIQTRYKLKQTWNENRVETTPDLKCKHNTNYIRQHTISYTKHWMQTHCKLHSGNTLQTTPDLKCKHTTNYIRPWMQTHYKLHQTTHYKLHPIAFGVSFAYVTWRIPSDRTEIHSWVWYDSLLQICGSFRSWVWRDSFVSIRMCGMMHLYVWRDSFVCVT